MSEKFRFFAISLSAILVLTFLLQNIFPSFESALILTKNPINQPWRYLTAIFLHGNIAHLLYNIFALVLFGTILEKYIGSRKFLLTFLATGILANVISALFYNASLGASGAIFGIIGALVILNPGLMVWTFGVPLPIFLAGILWVAGDLIGAYGFFVGNPLDNTGNIAHLSGIAFGFILGLIFRFTVPITWKKEKTQPVRLNENEIRRWEDFYIRRH